MTSHCSPLVQRHQINIPWKRQPRRVKSISSCLWVGSTFWKVKPRCVTNMLSSHCSTWFNDTSCFLWSGLIPCLPCVQFLLYTCPLSTVSFCAILPSSPKVFGFVAQHPAADMNHCYLFQSTKFVSIPRNNGCAVPVLVKWDIEALVLVLMHGFSWTLQSHVLVSLIGDAFQASKKQERTVGARDLIVEALRHKVSSSVWPKIKKSGRLKVRWVFIYLFAPQ